MTAEAAQHRAPGMADKIAGDDPVGVARDAGAEIGDLAETQDAANIPIANRGRAPSECSGDNKKHCMLRNPDR